MQDCLNELRDAVASRNASLADQLPPRYSAIYETSTNERTDIGVFEEQLGKKIDENEGSSFMADYLAKINEIKAGIGRIHEGAEHLDHLKNKLKQTPTPDEEKAINNEIQKVLGENNRAIMATKAELESLRHENDLFHSKQPSSSETKIRENIHAAITRKFRVLLTEYQTIQTAYKKSVRDKIERQVKIAYPDVSEFELTEILEGADSTVAQQQIFARITGAHESLNYAYRDIQDKHRDVKRLEQSVVELHQMFVDLATLVDRQGEKLDLIAYAVNNAADYTEKADKDLIVAQQIQSKRKKWGCYISCCLIIVVIIVVLPIIVYVAK
ncbi:syntaxin [Gregarina niphandrodes]|uniref:Syntaxin n=1 Tax=Gregarina niphandrodes TaxID=110365 RepID=A0A023BCG4_GRENI|nr:syntaxin [Gregarina niphandrodes]EZG83903.1 syntaxin [Gregarina niphandrodes]|eukprot:XP_011128902.1 syntaxin [Gregarina niphandrodes]